MIPLFVSTTGEAEPAEAFCQRLVRSGEASRAEVLDWGEMLRRLFDPVESRLPAHDPFVLVAFVRYEDWDHFQDHLRDRSIEPSYDLVRHKALEVAGAFHLGSARWPEAEFYLHVLSPSSLAQQDADVMAFFASVTQLMAEELSGVERVRITGCSRGGAAAAAVSSALSGFAPDDDWNGSQFAYSFSRLTTQET